MTKISKVNQARISSAYVHRNTAVTGVKAVSGVDPIRPTANSTAYSSPNALVNFHHFYEQLFNLKKKYFEYYQSERDLGKSLEEITRPELDDIKKKIEFLIDQYNLALKNLLRLEEGIGGNNSSKIYEAVLAFKSNLLSIGINIEDRGFLSIDLDTLETKINQSLFHLSFLFEPKSGFISKVYNRFREIKIDKNDDKFSDIRTQYSHGSIIDKQG